jgi:hypothetical protein
MLLTAGICVLGVGLVACQKTGSESVAASSAAPASSAANVQPQIAAGTVTAVTASELTLSSQDVPATYELAAQTPVMVTRKGSVSDIKPGSFLGATNVPSADGSSQSTEVHIFPPGVKMGEGDRPMGPPSSSAPATRMTNGTVSAAGPADQGASSTRMTNGSVGQVSSDSSKGVQMVVAYQGGQRQITVSANTPVTVLSNGTMDQVKPGAKVVVGYVPGPNGSKQLTFVNIQP